MGWSGPNFQDPAEKRAAMEAAAAMAEQRAAEDARNDVLATAMVRGFAILADAVMAASGMTTADRAKVLDRGGIDTAPPADLAGAPGWVQTAAMAASRMSADDPEMDALLDCSCDETAPEWCPTHGVNHDLDHDLPDSDCEIGPSPKTGRGD